jgi:phospholipase/carboxylesterase
MPSFLAAVAEWQRVSEVGIECTALIGFSQGAIMALESTREPRAPAGREVSIADRFARAPRLPPHRVTLHLLHGKTDPVIPYSHTVLAAQQLVALGVDVTADAIPFVGHEINADVEDFLVDRLKAMFLAGTGNRPCRRSRTCAATRIQSERSAAGNRPHN